MADRGLRRSLQKRPPACSARGLKCFAVRVSTILPTTGPAKIKVEAKAEGLGFIQESGGRGSAEHCFHLFAMPLCYTRKKRDVNRKKNDNFGICAIFSQRPCYEKLRSGAVWNIDKGSGLTINGKKCRKAQNQSFRSSAWLFTLPLPSLPVCGGAYLLLGEDAVFARSR